MISNLLKAAVSVALSPVALVVDVVTFPASTLDGNDPFKRTGALLKNAGDCVSEAVKKEQA
jgi:hypothetical protein